MSEKQTPFRECFGDPVHELIMLIVNNMDDQVKKLLKLNKEEYKKHLYELFSNGISNEAIELLKLAILEYSTDNSIYACLDPEWMSRLVDDVLDEIPEWFQCTPFECITIPTLKKHIHSINVKNVSFNDVIDKFDVVNDSRDDLMYILEAMLNKHPKRYVELPGDFKCNYILAKIAFQHCDNDVIQYIPDETILQIISSAYSNDDLEKDGIIEKINDALRYKIAIHSVNGTKSIIETVKKMMV